MENKITDPIKYEDEYGRHILFVVKHAFCRLTYSKKCENVICISSLTVDIDHRKQGEAKLIMALAEASARNNQIQYISLQVLEGSWMKKWYERLGFVVVAEGYEPNMVIMTKKVF